MTEAHELTWHKFTAKDRPPYRESILVWRGLADSDGGFALIGRLWHDDLTDADYVAYKPDANGP